MSVDGIQTILNATTGINGIYPVYAHHSNAVDESAILVTLASGGIIKPGDLKAYSRDLIKVELTLNSETIENTLIIRMIIINALVKYSLGNNIFLASLNSQIEPIPLRRGGGDWQWFGIFDVVRCE